MFIIISSAILLSITLAILGVLSLWNRYIYFADGLAHSNFLTITLAGALNLPLIYTGFIVTIIFATLIFNTKNQAGRNESIIMVANLMLSMGLIITNLSPVKINIMGLLFGDLISVNITDLMAIFILLIITIIFIALYYKQIILTVINYDLAKIKGISVKKLEFSFLIILALSIFTAIKIVGALLVTSMLLIPAVSARLIAKTPTQMLVISVILSIITVTLGLIGAFYLNMPIAPITIPVGIVLYLILSFMKTA